MREIIPQLTPYSEVWVAKIVGAIAGSAISLAYVLPKGKREAAVRFLTGISAGIVFGFPVGLWLAHYLGIAEYLDVLEVALMGAAFASLSIWSALGLALRFLEKRYPIPKSNKSAQSEGNNEEQL